jgi:hypothetical protein
MIKATVENGRKGERKPPYSSRKNLYETECGKRIK